MTTKTCWLAALLLLVGCDPLLVPWDESQAEPGDGSGTGDPDDLDGDGVTAADGDCDDADASIHPGATEVWYDDLDQNCDGASDFDQDGDGFESSGYGGEDCNDVVASQYPGAEELENGQDDDCDGVADEWTAGFELELSGTMVLDSTAEISLYGTTYVMEMTCAGDVTLWLEGESAVSGVADLLCSADGMDEDPTQVTFSGGFDGTTVVAYFDVGESEEGEISLIGTFDDAFTLEAIIDGELFMDDGFSDDGMTSVWWGSASASPVP